MLVKIKGTQSILILVYISLLTTLKSGIVWAACSVATIPTEIGPICPEPQGLVSDILRILFGFAGGVALLLMIIGTGMYVFSSGSPERVEEAQKMIIAAISGVFLIFFSVFLLKFIGVDILGIPGLTSTGTGRVITP